MRIKFARRVDVRLTCVDIRQSPKTDVLVWFHPLLNGLLFMRSTPDNVGEAIAFALSIRRVRPFVRTDAITTISHERLEQSRSNLRAYSLPNIDDLVRSWRSLVKGQGHNRPKYVVA